MLLSIKITSPVCSPCAPTEVTIPPDAPIPIDTVVSSEPNASTVTFVLIPVRRN